LVLRYGKRSCSGRSPGTAAGKRGCRPGGGNG
jgi:hypothetical protein